MSSEEKPNAQIRAHRSGTSNAGRGSNVERRAWSEKNHPPAQEDDPQAEGYDPRNHSAQDDPEKEAGAPGEGQRSGEAAHGQTSEDAEKTVDA